MKAIGLDIGTTTISAIVIDGNTGIVLETITKDSNSFIDNKQEWEKVQDVNSILEKVNKIVSDLFMRHSPISCIGVTGQMHGIVYIDKIGNAVSHLYTWQDSRGDLFYKDDLSYAEYLSIETGYSLAAGYGAVTHFYNILNHLVPEDAVAFCTIQDYIAMKLSHNPKPLTHNTNAASFGLFDITKK